MLLLHVVIEVVAGYQTLRIPVVRLSYYYSNYYEAGPNF